MVGVSTALTEGRIARTCVFVTAVCAVGLLMTTVAFSSYRPVVLLQAAATTYYKAWNGSSPAKNGAHLEILELVAMETERSRAPAQSEMKQNGKAEGNSIRKLPPSSSAVAGSRTPTVTVDNCNRPLLDVWGDSKNDRKAAWSWPRPVIEEYSCRQNPSVVLCCKPSVTVLILMWSEKVFDLPFMPPGKASVLPVLCCNGVQVSYTSDRSQLDEADIVEFHLQDYSNPGYARPTRRDNQAWMVFNMEGHYQVPPGLPGQVNLWRSYSRSSDIVNPYLDVGECQARNSMVALETAFGDREKVPLVALVSNCNSHGGREGLLRALVAAVETHSLGKCFHNHVAPRAVGDRSTQEKALLGSYKFAFAVENAVCTDYITEKFHRTFRTGVVPVVVSVNGRPGYERFSPTLSSYLDVGRFKDVEAAAEAINAAARDEKAYMRYHAYRGLNPSEEPSGPYRETVMARRDNGLDSDWCKLADYFRISDGRKRLSQRRRSDIVPSQECEPAGSVRRKYP